MEEFWDILLHQGRVLTLEPVLEKSVPVDIFLDEVLGRETLLWVLAQPLDVVASGAAGLRQQRPGRLLISERAQVQRDVGLGV